MHGDEGSNHMKKILIKKAPTILSIASVIGVGVTAVLSAKSMPQYLSAVHNAEAKKEKELTKKEETKLGIVIFAPAIIAGLSTSACILGANILNRRNQAALMSLYALLDSSYKDYRKKVKDIYGDDADKIIVGEVAKDKYKKCDIQITDADKQLFYDDYSQRYFESTVEYVQGAEYHFNRNFALRGEATVNEFYDFLGIDRIPGGDDIGWVYDGGYENDGGCVWVDFEHQKIELEDGLECYMIWYDFEPGLISKYYDD